MTADPGRSGGEGTGLVGWHRHDITGTVHQARACFVDDAHPVLVLDPVTARDTIARVVFGWHAPARLWDISDGAREQAYRNADDLLAALASQERGE